MCKPLKTLLSLSALLILAACAAAVADSTQEISPWTLHTPVSQNPAQPAHLSLSDTHTPQNPSLYNHDTSASLAQIAAHLTRGYRCFNVEITAIVFDITTNELVASYGDLDRVTQAGNAFWPISAAILIDAYGIDIHREFPNTRYVFPNGVELLSMKRDDFYTGYTTLYEGILHGSRSAFFHALEAVDCPDKFFVFAENLGLSFDWMDEIAEDVPWLYFYSIAGELLITPRQIAQLYMSLLNSGKLHADFGTAKYEQVFSATSALLACEVLFQQIAASDENSEALLPIRKRRMFEDFESGFAGFITAHSGMTRDTDGTNPRLGPQLVGVVEWQMIQGGWFIGFYPAVSPTYGIVINTAYDMWDRLDWMDFMDFLEASPNHSPPVYPRLQPGIHLAVAFAYEVFEQILSDRDTAAASTEGISADFLPVVSDIQALLAREYQGFVYFGRDTCPACLTYNAFLEYVYLNRRFIPTGLLHYFDTDFWRQNELFAAVIAEFGITSVPALVFFSGDGTFEVLHVDIDNMEDMLSWGMFHG